MLPVSWIDRNTLHFDEDVVVSQPGQWDGLHLGFAGRYDLDGFHCLGSHRGLDEYEASREVGEKARRGVLLNGLDAAPLHYISSSLRLC